MSFDISESEVIRAAVMRFNIAYRIRERVNVIPRPNNALNPRIAKVLVVRNLRESADSVAPILIALQPGMVGTVYSFSPEKVEDGYSWLFVEIGSPVQYAGFVVAAVGDSNTFEYKTEAEPPTGVYSWWLTDDELQQTITLFTHIAQAQAEIAEKQTQMSNDFKSLADILAAARARA